MNRRARCLAALLSSVPLSLCGVRLAASESLPADQGAVDSRGAEVFKTTCAVCHENPTSRAPPPVMLGQLSPNSILRALQVGVMRPQGQGISDEDKAHVAQFLSKRRLSDAADSLSPPKCQGNASTWSADQLPPFAGWGLTPQNTRETPRAAAGIDKSNIGKLHLKWAVGFSGAIRIRSQPAVAGGSIFVGTEDGTVYALDQASGCARWQYQAPTEIRTPIIASSWNPGNASAWPMIYFGDQRTLYALDARTGREVWRKQPDAHVRAQLTAAPVLYKDKVLMGVSSIEEMGSSLKYECCTFRGSLVAYNARTGKEVWRAYTVDPPKVQRLNSIGTKMWAPSGAPIWNAAAIDEKRSQLYVGTGDNYSRPASMTSDSIIAIDANNGAIKWVFQATNNDVWNTGCIWGEHELCPQPEGPDFDFAAAPILATTSDGRDLVIAGQKSGVVFALDPATGALVWKTKVAGGGNSGGIEFGMAVKADSVFVGANDFDDHREHVDPLRPGLYALDLRSGEYLWKSPDSRETCRGRSLCEPGIYAAITVSKDLVLAGNTDGWLRAYDAADGRVVWHYDMTQPVTTVGGGKASGGSMGGPTAPMVVGKLLIVPSGYGMLQYTPGNVLFVFEIN